MKISFTRTIVFAASLLVAACQSQAEAPEPSGASATAGEHVFTKHCSTCHGATGKGIEPWYPSLERLAALREPSQMVETVITGRFRRGGEIGGHTIPIMPAWGQLTDSEVAAIVNYVQQTWGKGTPISIEDVTKTRASLWEID